MGARIVAATILVSLTACAAPATTSDDETASTNSANAPTATAAPPADQAPAKYSVIGQAHTRVDGESVYFVLVDPVDFKDDGFKQDVRLVLQAVAKTDGGPDFSARVFDNRAIATEALSQETNPQMDVSPEAKAFEERKGEHLVAMYVGGLTTGLGYPYYLSWYPGASTDTPNAGQYVDSEQWKPGAA